MLFMFHDLQNTNEVLICFCRITAKIDDDMLAYYCNEDLFLLEVRQVPTAEEELYDITFVELQDH